MDFIDYLNAFFTAAPNFLSHFLQNAITSWNWRYYFALAHDIGIFTDTLVILGLGYVLVQLAPFRARYYADPRKAIPAEAKVVTLRTIELARKWEELKKRAELAPPHSMTLGILEADAFVDTVLKTVLNLQGEHMADRLEQLDSGLYPTLEGVWQAHKARNNVAHTPGYELPEREARRFFKNYEAFLQEVGVL